MTWLRKWQRKYGLNNEAAEGKNGYVMTYDGWRMEEVWFLRALLKTVTYHGEKEKDIFLATRPYFSL